MSIRQCGILIDLSRCKLVIVVHSLFRPSLHFTVKSLCLLVSLCSTRSQRYSHYTSNGSPDMSSVFPLWPGFWPLAIPLGSVQLLFANVLTRFGLLQDDEVVAGSCRHGTTVVHIQFLVYHRPSSRCQTVFCLASHSDLFCHLNL